MLTLSHGVVVGLRWNKVCRLALSYCRFYVPIPRNIPDICPPINVYKKSRSNFIRKCQSLETIRRPP